MSKNLIPYVLKTENGEDCKFYFNEFMKVNHDRIVSFSTGHPYKVVLENGETIYFMTFKTYDRWCLGRTYKYLGQETIYHSGMKDYRRERTIYNEGF